MTADTTWQPATVTIPEGPLAIPTIKFVRDSALAFCTELRSDLNGHLSVVQSWPSLSSGERVLWSLLESLTGGDLYAAFDKLDAHNLGVLGAVFTAAVGEVTA